MINVHIYKKTYQMPENWNELTGKQLVQMAHVLLQAEHSYNDKVKLLKICLGISDRSFINYAYLPKWLTDSLFWKKVEVLLFLDRSIDMVDFLLKENTLTKQLQPRLVHWTAIENYWAPISNFENLKMEEFCFSEFHFLLFKQTQSFEALVDLVATLYRPAKKGYNLTKNNEGDIRVPFNENLTKHYAKYVRHFSVAQLKGVLIWYMGCRLELVKLFPKVFSGKNTDGKSFGLFSLITSVAEDGVMGDFDKVNSKLVHTILLRLTELINRAEKMEAELKATK